MRCERVGKMTKGRIQVRSMTMTMRMALLFLLVALTSPPLSGQPHGFTSVRGLTAAELTAICNATDYLDGLGPTIRVSARGLIGTAVADLRRLKPAVAPPAGSPPSGMGAGVGPSAAGGFTTWGDTLNPFFCAGPECNFAYGDDRVGEGDEKILIRENELAVPAGSPPRNVMLAALLAHEAYRAGSNYCYPADPEHRSPETEKEIVSRTMDAFWIQMVVLQAALPMEDDPQYSQVDRDALNARSVEVQNTFTAWRKEYKKLCP